MSEAADADIEFDREPLEDDPGLEPEATDPNAPPAHLKLLTKFAKHNGNLCDLLSESEIASLGADVVEDYERDDQSRSEWKTKAKKALDRATQEKIEAKEYPWKDAANINYPLLTTAALQFHARAYSAVVKNDEAVMIKVFGSPNPPELPAPEGISSQGPEAEALWREQFNKLWSDRRKAKKRRADRVSQYMNYTLFYRLEDWEGDTDTMLLQLPIVGCGFRKVWQDADTQRERACYVPGLRLVVNQEVRNIATAPRITEEIPDVFPYQIKGRMAAGEYRTYNLVQTGDDDQAARMLLEQHRMHDLDGDGIEEPYIVTVDHEQREVLRIEAAYTLDSVKLNGEKVVGFERTQFYQKYGFIPDPKGRFYDIGFGHMLDQITDAVNATINEIIDAGHAQVAGGGFIASGLRLQGNGQTNVVRWRPGEYKTTNHPKPSEAIWERTFPAPSAVSFSLLEMMLGAAKQITATQDVLTGDAAKANAPVGTTLALIEQGLSVFVAIYKRIYRSLKGEFRLLYDCIGRYGDQEDYEEVVDDPEADLKRDFSAKGEDILPVADPQAATKMQAIAKAQLLLGLTGRGLNDQAIYLRAFRDLGIDEPEELVSQAPNPMAAMEGEKMKSEIEKNTATAGKTRVEAAKIATETAGMMHAADQGGVPGLEGAPGDEMGEPGPPGGGGSPAPAMGGADLGLQPVG